MTDLHESRDVLLRFRAGDAATLREVFRAHAGALAHAARKGVRVMGAQGVSTLVGQSSELEVQRLVQEVFSRAFSPAARAAYDGLTPYGAYLRGILRHVMVDELRARGRRPEVLDNDMAALTLEDPSPGPAALAEQEEVRRVVNHAVGTLPDLEQRVYRARFVDGLSQVEAADALGKARISVRRAEARLKEAVLRAVQRHGMKPGEVDHG